MTAAAADHTGHQDGFVHLHVHTEYSMLDGAARLKDMFAQCEREGMSAVAMTDHGNLYGAYDFWSKGTKAGIKPIIGIEAYVAPEHRRLDRYDTMTARDIARLPVAAAAGTAAVGGLVGDIFGRLASTGRGPA